MNVSLKKLELVEFEVIPIRLIRKSSPLPFLAEVLSLLNVFNLNLGTSLSLNVDWVISLDDPVGIRAPKVLQYMFCRSIWWQISKDHTDPLIGWILTFVVGIGNLKLTMNE